VGGILLAVTSTVLCDHAVGLQAQAPPCALHTSTGTRWCWGT
jgi:hypothetical protein